MDRKFSILLFLAGLLISLVSVSFALEKVKLGSAVKLHAPYYLPVLAAEEKGFWKENSLDVEWVPFAGGTPHMHAVAAGAINAGLTTSDEPLMAAERGLPVIIVAELVPSTPFTLWVRADSPYRHVRDLKGKRVGVTTLGSSLHAHGRIIFAAHGIEKEVRFVGAGGVAEYIAALKTGGVEAVMSALVTTVGLKVEGVVREVDSSSEYLPKPWFDRALYARRDFARSKPDTVKRVVKATLQATDFMRKNPGWTIGKIKSFQGISEEAAKLVHDNTKFTITGKIDRKAMENVRKVLIEYGILTEKVPAVDELFTNEYLP